MDVGRVGSGTSQEPQLKVEVFVEELGDLELEVRAVSDCPVPNAVEAEGALAVAGRFAAIQLVGVVLEATGCEE